jgi:large subunit ribosomal protein L7/L12
MAKLTKDEIINAISEYTIMELADLVKGIEEKFGVKAAPTAVAVAAAPGAAAVEEKTEFTVVLKGLTEPGKKIGVIKVVREVTGLGLKESKEMVEGAPKNIKENIEKKDAEELKKKLETAGAVVELK